VSKDALYTLGAQSKTRRSIQTAMYIMADGLTRLLAPLLPVTTDELWQHLPGSREESVHLADFPKDIERLHNPALHKQWNRLLAIRDAVNNKLETIRQEKSVGTSLEARIMLRANGTTAELLEQYLEVLPTLFITSEVSVVTDPTLSINDAGTHKTRWEELGGTLEIDATPAEGVKCPRCWRYVQPSTEYPNVCERCVSALPETVSAT